MSVLRLLILVVGGRNLFGKARRERSCYGSLAKIMLGLLASVGFG